MSSNIRIKRICQFCDTDFIAKTTVTKYCSDNCAKRAYKARMREEKVKGSNEETQSIISRPIEEIKAKDFLSISETCTLLGISRWTLWRAIKSNHVKAHRLGRRVIIKREDLNKIFQ